MQGSRLVTYFLAFLAIGVAALSIITFSLWQGRMKTMVSHKIKIVTTLFPLYDFAREVGGDKVDVTLLLPPGVEAHSFEPKPSDIVKISEADLFIYTGKYMEPWAGAILKSVPGKTVIDASAGVKMIPEVFHDKNESAGAPDHHIWLDFGNDMQIVREIEKELSGIDPSNAAYYGQRAQAYIRILSALDNTFRTTLSRCESREIIYGGHYAFGYLASRYHLIYVAAQGVSPDAEPSAKDLARLVDQIKRDRVPFVFYEELSSPKVSETIARETKTRLLLLNAAHNITKMDFDNNVSFISLMQENLSNLSVGLQCNKQP